MTTSNVPLGVMAALGAGLLWGLVFVAPLLLPSYPPALLTFGRYLAFGLVTLPIAWVLRAALKRLKRADWVLAFKLSLIGNFLYYITLAAAIQLAGAPLPTLIIGALPVVIAVVSNLNGADRVRWRRIAPSLLLIVLGLLCVNADQLARLATPAATLAPSAGSIGSHGVSAVAGSGSLADYLAGAALAWVALAAWTWYPIQNARWLQAHPQHSATTWASAQGLVTLPVAALGLAAVLAYYEFTGHARFGFTQLGEAPAKFWGLMLLMGFSASWLGTLLWNIASKNTPTALTGQLIVFETLAALAYAYLVYQRPPSALELAGIALLVSGVVVGVRVLSKPAV